MEQFNYNTTIPSDWIYVIKEALNYRIFSNPVTMSDIIDIVVDELEIEFEKFTSFEYHDADRTISVRVPSEEDKSNTMYQVVENVIWRFCSSYISSIEYAIVERKGRGQYLQLFDDIMQSRNTKMLAQLVTTNIIYFKQNNEMLVSIRFY